MSVNDLFSHQPDIYFSTNNSDNELIETKNSKYSKIYPGILLYQQYPDGIPSALRELADAASRKKPEFIKNAYIYWIKYHNA